MSFRPHHHVRTSAVSVRKSCITRRAVSTWALVGRYILMKNISSAVRMEVCRQKLLACTTKTNTSGLWHQQTSLSGGGRNMDMFGCGRMATCRSVVCTSRTRVHVAPSESGACIGSVLPAYDIFGCKDLYVCTRAYHVSQFDEETAIRLSKWCGPSKLCIKTGTILYHSFGLRRKMSSLVTY
jgi:hypothetical protein